jgi:hypothetical protein
MFIEEFLVDGAQRIEIDFDRIKVQKWYAELV